MKKVYTFTPLAADAMHETNFGRTQIMHSVTIAITIFLLASAYFLIPIAAIWVPAVAAGCFWPDSVADIIEINADPGSSFRWWISAIELAVPRAWELAPQVSNGTYWGCVRDQYWNLAILTSSVVLPFMLIAAPGSMAFGWLCGKAMGRIFR